MKKLKTCIAGYIFCVIYASSCAGDSAAAGLHTFILDNNIRFETRLKSWVELRDERVVRQKYDYSCGASSLATILNHFFNDVMTEEEILTSIIERKGVYSGDKAGLENKSFALSFEDIREFAESKAYRSFGLALPMESLMQLRVPAIVYVKVRGNEHFTVYKGMNEHFTFLADPSYGNIKVRTEKFREMFSTRDDLQHPGKVLVLLRPGEDKKLNSDFIKLPGDSGFIYDVIDVHKR